jgi:hypothetical protein
VQCSHKCEKQECEIGNCVSAEFPRSRLLHSSRAHTPRTRSRAPACAPPQPLITRTVQRSRVTPFPHVLPPMADNRQPLPPHCTPEHAPGRHTHALTRAPARALTCSRATRARMHHSLTVRISTVHTQSHNPLSPPLSSQPTHTIPFHPNQTYLVIWL